MVLKNRSRVEIIYDIISAAKPVSKKTHLMYKGNLSYQQLDLYLTFMLRNGLLEERIVDDSRLYFATQKGLEFLRLFEDLHNLITPVKSENDELGKLKIPSAVNPIKTENFVY
jgi:predicted transcriptional regulator